MASNIKKGADNSENPAIDLLAKSTANDEIDGDFYYELFQSGKSCDVTLVSGIDQKR